MVEESNQKDLNLATYKWTFHPHLYSDAQLSEFTGLLNKNIDISPIENPRYSADQIKLLGRQLENGRDLTKLILLKSLPSAGVLTELFNNDTHYDELMSYLRSTTDLKTMMWILSWVGTRYEKGLAPLLNYPLNWAQRDSLTKIYKQFINHNGNYLDPRILVKYNVPFDLMDSIYEIYEKDKIDLTVFIKSYDFESLKNIIFATKNNVPKKYFEIKTLSSYEIEDIEDLYLTLVKSYKLKDIDNLIVNLINNHQQNISKTVMVAKSIEFLKSHFKIICKNLNKGIPKFILTKTINSQPSE